MEAGLEIIPILNKIDLPAPSRRSGAKKSPDSWAAIRRASCS